MIVYDLCGDGGRYMKDAYPAAFMSCPDIWLPFHAYARSPGQVWKIELLMIIFIREIELGRIVSCAVPVE